MMVLVPVSWATATTTTDNASKSLDWTATSLTSDDPSSSNSYSYDSRMWTANVLDGMKEYWAAKGSGQCSNSDTDFSESSTRFYSPSENAVYCFTCKLMTYVSLFWKQGYNYCKRGPQAVSSHEKSSMRQEAMLQLMQRSDANNRVDAELVRQANIEREYLHAVLEWVQKLFDSYLRAVWHFVYRMKLSVH